MFLFVCFCFLCFVFVPFIGVYQVCSIVEKSESVAVKFNQNLTSSGLSWYVHG